MTEQQIRERVAAFDERVLAALAPEYRESERAARDAERERTVSVVHARARQAR